ncbi:WecB/TagA/CpsF family glycosyltransferase [Methylobacterium nigriterrae]|uniref:WecB/TagA/CpsF family glycosyltransferase n=1 Tax=Methylobacterium nigriterrae TaxID=3127512 RepID=UPI003013FC71
MSLSLFGIAFTTGDAAEVLATAAARPGPRPRLVVTANVDHIVALSENAAFRKAYAGAAARTLDGMPLVWLARLTGRYGAQRVTGHDLLACALAASRAPGTRVFLVCASLLVGERMRTRLVGAGLAPGDVAIAVPPFGFERDAAYGHALAERVRRHGTTLLVMGVGAPKSEIWVDRQGEALGAPVVLAVGEALNVAAGLAPRAPRLMQHAGLEWLFRFLHAPQRLFHRYFVRSWRFVRIMANERDHPAG